MKILNSYYGLEADNFKAEPLHAAVRYDCSEEEIEFQSNKAKQALVNKRCFWYVVTIIDIDPYTGAISHSEHWDTVGEKPKIVLNAKAKKPLKENPTTVVIPAIFTMIAGANAKQTNDWPIPMPPKFLAEEEVPF